MVIVEIESTDNVRCTYKNVSSIFGGFRYACFIQNQGVLYFKRLLGQHLKGYTNADVDIVSITNCHLDKVPRCLIQYFPNMRVLDLRQCHLDNICKADLIPFRSLCTFSSYNNPITHLSGDIFEGFEKLECIDFSKNELEIIEPTILNGLTNLRHVNFNGNPNYSKWFSTYPNIKPNATLTEIKDYLYEKFFERYKFVKALKDSNDKLIKEKQKWTNQLNKINDKNPQSGLISDIKMMINSEDTKDFAIKIDNRDYRVHKFILACRSPFFAQMFKERPDVNILILDDIPYFEQIIDYCYTDEFPKVPNYVTLLSVAGKLQISKLCEYAASLAENNINDDNAVEVFTICCKNGYEKPMKEAYARIKKKYSEFINFKDEWLTQPNDLISIVEGFKKQDDSLKKFIKKFES